jgi:diguanylate cyclase (GGDEF)-like protein
MAKGGIMKKYIYAVIMILYIGISITAINYASNWMIGKNYSIFASKARDIAKLTVKNYRITDTEVEELLKLDFKDIIMHPANIRMADLFSDKDGYDDIQFVYVMTQLVGDQIKYLVTEEYVDFFEAPVGTPLNAVWLVDVNIGKTMEEVLADNKNYYDDVRRYSLLRYTNETAFRDKTPTNAIVNDETGFLISAIEPFYSEEGTFVGMIGVDIYIDEYQKMANSIRLLLFIVFLLPSGALTVVYIIFYVINLKKVLITAQTDPLTSVKNRRFMEKYLSQSIKEHYKKQLPLSVIMIDIDYFKKYNDNYGHQQGDKVLVNVTAAISSVLRDRTDVICRYGGEEFLVILTNTKTVDAERVASRIKTTVNGIAIKHEFSDVCDVVTVSQGVYSAVPSSMSSDKAFIEYADKGLYEAKNTGRNKYFMVES